MRYNYSSKSKVITFAIGCRGRKRHYILVFTIISIRSGNKKGEFRNDTSNWIYSISLLNLVNRLIITLTLLPKISTSIKQAVIYYAYLQNTTTIHFLLNKQILHRRNSCVYACTTDDVTHDCILFHPKRFQPWKRMYKT